jgi:hypothetical protein
MKYKSLAVLVLAVASVSSAEETQHPVLTADTKVEGVRPPARLKTCPDPQHQPPQRKRPSEFQRLYPEVRMIASAS